MNQPLILIPAAGFGTRVGSPLVKELLPDGNQSPLIDFALEQALARDWPVHVITRKEKQPLLEHLQKWRARGLRVSTQLVGVTREWPQTLLLSKDFWHEQNLILLPDTRFRPIQVLDHMQKISGVDVTYAVCSSANLEMAKSWGVVQLDPFSLCEKPQETLKSPYLFWGLMQFRKQVGEALLSAHLESTFDHQWKALQFKAGHVLMEDFVDLTRGN